LIILVIGLGSMGRRRIRLIQQYNPSHQIIGVDLSPERRETALNEFGIATSGNLEEMLQIGNQDCAFVCTSPLSHNALIASCLEHNLHVFTELNLVKDGYDENIQRAQKNEKTLFLSSTFLHRAEIKKIDQLVKEHGHPLNYTYHIGQYLPDWHPWEHYKDFFVGDKRTNGCREIFAIELPWLIHVFGEIKDMAVKKSKISTLNLDYNDNYMVLLEHESGNKGMLAVDVVSRKAVRNLEVYGEELYLSWDGSPLGLKQMDLERKMETDIQLYDHVDQLSNYSKFVVENAYFNEIQSFFEAIHQKTTPIYNFEKDKKVLDYIDRIEA
jgi:predicted dehydrogenase